MHLTFRQLRYFVEIADAGSMNKAAERLHLATTALSLQVRGMEDRLGVGLLERHARGVFLTEPGAKLYARARELLTLADLTEREVSSSGRAAPHRIRLGIPHSIAQLVGIDAIMRAEAEGGRFVLSLREGISMDLLDLLASDELDFVLGCELPSYANLESLDLMEEQLLYVTSLRDPKDDGGIALADVLKADLAFFSEKDASWRLLLAAAAAAGLAAPCAPKVESLNTLRQMVVRGKAAVVATYGAFREEYLRGEVGLAAIRDARLVRRLSLTWSRARRMNVEDERFIGYVLEIMSLLHCRTSGYSRMLVGDPDV